MFAKDVDGSVFNSKSDSLNCGESVPLDADPGAEATPCHGDADGGPDGGPDGHAAAGPTGRPRQIPRRPRWQRPRRQRARRHRGRCDQRPRRRPCPWNPTPGVATFASRDAADHPALDRRGRHVATARPAAAGAALIVLGAISIAGVLLTGRDPPGAALVITASAGRGRPMRSLISRRRWPSSGGGHRPGSPGRRTRQGLTPRPRMRGHAGADGPGLYDGTTSSTRPSSPVASCRRSAPPTARPASAGITPPPTDAVGSPDARDRPRAADQMVLLAGRRGDRHADFAPGRARRAAGPPLILLADLVADAPAGSADPRAPAGPVPGRDERSAGVPGQTSSHRPAYASRHEAIVASGSWPIWRWVEQRAACARRRRQAAHRRPVEVLGARWRRARPRTTPRPGARSPGRTSGAMSSARPQSPLYTRPGPPGAGATRIA